MVLELSHLQINLKKLTKTRDLLFAHRLSRLGGSRSAVHISKASKTPTLVTPT